MKNIRLIMAGFLCLFIQTLVGCDKAEFLDAKPTTAIVRPVTLEDFQGLLENQLVQTGPSLALLSADEYEYVSYKIYQTLRTATERNAYVWGKDLFTGEVGKADWNGPYRGIFYANNVLRGLEEYRGTANDQSRMNFLRGWALFLRGYAYYELVNNFSAAYDESTANADLGVPLKLNPSIDVNLPRATVKQTYEQVLMDLQGALPMLGTVLQANRNRPSRITVNALLARIYLSMRKYGLAEKYVDDALKSYNKLIDYNTVSTTTSQPFPRTNDELIYQKSLPADYIGVNLSPRNSFYTMNHNLLSSYAENDLRPAIYFRKQTSGAYTMKLQYGGAANGLYAFTGLAVDELYLIKAECSARRSDVTEALKYLNTLLINRFKTNSFVPITATSPDEVTKMVIEERRKELVFRCLRWSDLKRLNKEGWNITLSRQLDGITYTLPPNDPRYIFPIPDNEIELSGIQQNQR